MTKLIEQDQSESWYAEVPRSVTRHAIFGFTLMVVAFGGFGAWAFRAPLAAAVIAQGSFVATGQNKIVQHLEGGIIKDILVSEGDVVAAGQTMLRLDETAALANERVLFFRQLRLEATEARLLAEYNEDDRLVFPQYLEAARSHLEIATVLDGQALAFEVAKSALENDIALLERNTAALRIRARGHEAQLTATKAQLAIIEEDLETNHLLMERGLMRQAELNAVRRAKAEAEGQIGRLEAEISEIAEMTEKHAAQIEKARSKYRQSALDELNPIQAELDSIREKARKAQNVLARSDVAAPVNGTVVRLYYHTSGGVIESGKAIAEILPANEPLIVEIQVPRTEIDSVRVGAPATVRLSALNQRTTPVLDGEVFYVSADAITEKTDGVTQEVYVARVRLPPEEIQRVPGFSPTPGMPAEIMVQTAERTFVQYLAKPIKDSMSRAFREQ
ncbi:MAG: HlyD family type I secretion periplasmic adaptor subunit [Pseudomonadota bacterium]